MEKENDIKKENDTKKQQIENQIKELKSIRAELEMNRKQFSEYMQIPLRTMEEWEAGRRKMPDYVLRLIAYYTKMEQIQRLKKREEEQDGEK